MHTPVLRGFTVILVHGIPASGITAYNKTAYGITVIGITADGITVNGITAVEARQTQSRTGAAVAATRDG